MLMKISLHISNNIKSKTQDREGKKKKNTKPFTAWKQRFIPVSLCNFFYVTLMARQEADQLCAWRQFHPVCFLLSPFLTLHTFTPSLIFTFVKNVTRPNADTPTDTITRWATATFRWDTHEPHSSAEDVSARYSSFGLYLNPHYLAALCFKASA